MESEKKSNRSKHDADLSVISCTAKEGKITAKKLVDLATSTRFDDLEQFKKLELLVHYEKLQSFVPNDDTLPKIMLTAFTQSLRNLSQTFERRFSQRTKV